MRKRITPEYERWVESLFGTRKSGVRIGSKKRAYASKSALDGATAAEFLRHLFENTGLLIEHYSSDKIAHGLEKILDSKSIGFDQVLRGAESNKRQVRLIESLFPLYRDLFAKLCTRPILDTEGKCVPKSKLEHQCTTLWWSSDVWRAATSPSTSHLHDATFEILEQILSLNSSDCQEAVLYALDKIRPAQPERVRKIATAFLSRQNGVEACLRERAEELLAPECPDSPDLDFDQWIQYVFDHPVEKNAWYWRSDESGHLDQWQLHPATLSEHMARLFEQPAFLAERYSPAQINQAFWFFPFGDWDYYEYALRDEVPEITQQRWVRAIPNLYRKLFAPLCSPHMGSQPINQDIPENPLNRACYMFWDMNDLYALVSSFWHRHVWPYALRALEQILEIDSIPCQESALHGLGHLYKTIPDRVQSIIRRFPQSGKKLHPALQDYAEAAGKGWVQ